MSNLRSGRRRFLQAAGLSLALPALEAFPTVAAAGDVRAPLTTESGAPLRTAFIYHPNGVNVDHWRPEGEGEGWKAGKTLAELDRHRANFSVLSGLEHRTGYQHRDGGGDHARANATFLTGAYVKKTAGADIKLGQSVDQRIVEAAGDVTRLPSLELSCDAARKSGGCDSGYACAYQFNLSWKDETTPAPPECDPRIAFERLFGAGTHGQRQKNYWERMKRQKSMLDFLRGQTSTMSAALGKADRDRLDEYLTGVRELERRIQLAEQVGPPVDPDAPTPAGIPDDFGEHIDLMFDVMRLAFQTDTTRVSTFMLSADGSNRSFPQIGVSESHHDLSHHGKRAEKLDKIQKIDAFYLQRFAAFLDKLSETKDFDGRSLLDNSAIVYGSGLSDGDRHSHQQLPVIAAGRAGGVWTPGRHVATKSDTPMTNLYVSMLQAAGINDSSFSDSEGPLRGV